MTKSAQGLRIYTSRLSSNGMTYLRQWQKGTVNLSFLGGR